MVMVGFRVLRRIALQPKSSCDLVGKTIDADFGSRRNLSVLMLRVSIIAQCSISWPFPFTRSSSHLSDCQLHIEVFFELLHIFLLTQ